LVLKINAAAAAIYTCGLVAGFLVWARFELSQEMLTKLGQETLT
jgi:hypothetical protein